MTSKISSKARLQLSRETLRKLSGAELAGVAGGTYDMVVSGERGLVLCNEPVPAEAVLSMDPNPNCPNQGPVIENPNIIRFGRP